MSSIGADRYREWAGVYVLGALTPSERHEFEEHFSECAKCAAAVDECAGLPAMLNVLTSGQATALGQTTKADPPPQLLTDLAEKIRRRQHRMRLTVAGLVLGASAAAPVLTSAIPSGDPIEWQCSYAGDSTYLLAPATPLDPVRPGPARTAT